MTDRFRESRPENPPLVGARVRADFAAAVLRSTGRREHIGSHREWPLSSVAYAVSVALTSSYASGALAQDAAADLEVIIVTARKREETLLEIPQEIQAIGQQEMERANISTVQDLQRFVPSLTYNGTTPGRGAIYFRGVADDTEAGIADSSAAVYLDEQPLTQTQMQPEVRLVDMERIEALPGPQGTLYGSSAIQWTTAIRVTSSPAC
jgi:outer membrane receptor protein involved in Fe transport